ncbi:MAG TPA: mannose-1-phosphate guanylyltransferase [Propionibacteriaceae bacterium]|nr:mannose-1-phosphate guanylyltransferase [Propionibacteriaceae bacterium]HQE32284.1 mannose-1-phosphate guanylyltransferase [Propionibacteriaceae bacterium]
MRYVVIMAGGAGTRLWPLSRQGMPKQLLHLVDDTSLLRIAYERVAGAVPDANILVCAGAAYMDVVAAELPELPAENLLGEPVGRDSLNAVAWPAAVLVRRDPDAIVATLTADHIIRPIDAFQEALDEAFTAVERDPSAMVTFGVVPTGPHTGFGYLHRGDKVAGLAETYDVSEFREKPDAATAQSYVDSGEYWWNSGMFVWRAATLLEQLEVLQPETLAGVTELAQHPDRIAELYPTLPKNSVDFAVMEPVSQGRGSAHVVAVRLPIEWYDVGGFPALAPHLPQADGNAVEGSVVSVASEGNLVVNRGPEGTIVAVVGLSDTVVVTSGNVVLVCPMAAAEQIKQLVEAVKQQVGPEYS